MKLDKKIEKRIEKYKPKGNLDQTARVIIALMSVKHADVKNHSQRVALIAEKVAQKLKWDTKAAFFVGLLHDTAKLVLPSNLFDGHDINREEFEIIKEHGKLVFEIFKDIHLFIAFCAGIHHNVYKSGYGIELEDLLKEHSELSLETIKNMLNIGTLVSICDYVDAATHRSKRTIHSGGDKKEFDWKTNLKNKYPNEQDLIKKVLQANRDLEL